MKKIRFISKDIIREAYEKSDEPIDNIGEYEETYEKKLEKIPKEAFQIIGKVVSFIELGNELEDRNNED